MATAGNGATVPAGTTVFDLVQIVNDLNTSLHGRLHILAANATARAALTSTCGWTPTTTEPLVVLQTDTDALWRYNGTAWTPITDVFAGTEGVIVGTPPSAGAVIRTQSTTVTQTTDSTGILVITSPTVAPHAIVSAQLTNATAGAGLIFIIQPAGCNLTGLVVKVCFAADGSNLVSASATVSLTITYW